MISFKKILFVFGLLVIANYAQAARQWTANNVWGQGISVEAVYPQFQTKQLIFKAGDGQSYYYQWDSAAAEMPGDVKVMMSILLASLSSGKNVNVYADPEITSNGRINFTLLSVVK